MNLSKLKKSLLVLSGVGLVCSCGQIDTSSSDSSSDSSSSTEEYEEKLTGMFNELSRGVALESLVTITSSTGVGDTSQTAYGRFYLDVQTTRREYAYQQYEAVEDKTSLPTRENIADSAYYYSDPFGNTCSNYLLINNSIYSYQITQESVKGTQTITWEDSGLCNIFYLLKANMFDKNGDTYSLNDNADAPLRRKILSNLYGTNTVPAVKDFTLTGKDGHIASYTLSSEVQSRRDESYGVTYTLQYEMSGNIVAYGSDNANVTKNFIKEVEGEKDEEFEGKLAVLRNHNYKETTSLYRVSEPDLSLKGTLAQKNVTIYTPSTKLANTYSSSNILTSSKAYYITSDNFIQELITINGGYYNQGLKLSNSALTSPFPSFDMSSLFFKKEAEGLYTYEMGYKNCQIFSTGLFSEVTTSLVYYASIDFTKENAITISSIYAVSSGSDVIYCKMVSTYTDIGSADTGIDVASIKDGDDLTWDDYFKNDKELVTAKSILGDKFDAIPVLGGYYNDVTLYTSQEDRQVQFQYYLGSLAIYDFDGDGELSSYEQAALYSEVDRTLRPYSEKLDQDIWKNLKAGFYPGTSLCIELVSTQQVEDGFELTLDIYFTYSSQTSDAYIVIDAKYDDKVTVTFDYNYEGAENVVETINRGSKVNEPNPPRRKGYIFLGWYTDEKLETKVDFKNPITSDTTFYAKWEPNT